MELPLYIDDGAIKQPKLYPLSFNVLMSCGVGGKHIHAALVLVDQNNINFITENISGYTVGVGEYVVVLIMNQCAGSYLLLGDQFKIDNLTYMSCYLKDNRNSNYPDIFYVNFTYADNTILKIESTESQGYECFVFANYTHSYITHFSESNLKIISTFQEDSNNTLVLTRSGNYRISDYCGDQEITEININLIPLKFDCISYRDVFYKQLIGFLILDRNHTLSLSLRSVKESLPFLDLNGVLFEGVIDYSELVIVRVTNRGRRGDTTSYLYKASILILTIGDDGNKQLILLEYKIGNKNNTRIVKTRGEVKFSCCYRDNKLNKSARII